MKQRIISGVIIAIAILALGFVGSYPLYMGVLFCCVIGYMELTAVLCASAPTKSANGKKKSNIRRWNSAPDLIAVPGLLLTVLYYAGLMYIEWRYGLVNRPAMTSAADFWTVLLLILDFLLTMVIFVYTFPKRKSYQAVGAVAAFVYVTIMMSYLCRARNLSHGIFMYLLIFVCSSVSDVCALAVGMAIGKHKLAPVLSPKKTIEGAIGGVLGSAGVSSLVALVLHRIDPSVNVVVLFLIIGICGSIISQTGDLCASAIKRNSGLKDYGNLIPGHGGIMDRFDSVIFTAPVIYYLAVLLMSRF